MPDADTLKFSPLAEDSKREILAAYMVNPDISLLDKVKIQAQVLIPVLRAFRAALGAEQADQIVHAALREWSQQLFRDIGAQIKGSPMQKWAALRAAISSKANENVDFEMLRQEPEAGLIKIGDIRTVFLVQMSQFLFLCPDLSGLPERQKRPSGREQKQDILPLSAYPDFHHPSRRPLTPTSRDAAMRNFSDTWESLTLARS